MDAHNDAIYSEMCFLPYFFAHNWGKEQLFTDDSMYITFSVCLAFDFQLYLSHHSYSLLVWHTIFQKSFVRITVFFSLFFILLQFFYSLRDYNTKHEIVFLCKSCTHILYIYIFLSLSYFSSIFFISSSFSSSSLLLLLLLLLHLLLLLLLERM